MRATLLLLFVAAGGAGCERSYADNCIDACAQLEACPEQKTRLDCDHGCGGGRQVYDECPACIAGQGVTCEQLLSGARCASSCRIDAGS